MSDLIHYSHGDIKPYYIAVCQHGYGIDRVAAMAIRLAQTRIPATAEESQLLIYRHQDEVEPEGFKGGEPVWPNGNKKDENKPKLCGLTTTHQAFKQKPRL